MLLYLHIPFCNSKCSYCGFNSFTNIFKYKNIYMQEAIIKQFEFEIKRFNLKEKSISSLFIGGGTPSLVDTKLYSDFFKTIKPYMQENAEITSEANPSSSNKKWLYEMKKLGVNRISFGVQSFDDKKLKFLGRNHTKESSISSVLNAKEVGFKNISIDLIYSTIKDNKKLLENDIKIASSLPINHISAYSLTLEENTPFYMQEKKQKDSLVLANFLYKKLKENGFNAYEISNFERGYKCKHNIGYWKHKKYIGIGSGAVGYNVKNRIYPQSDPVEYIKNPLIFKHETLTKNDILLEKIFLGLRSFVGFKYKKLPLHVKKKTDLLIKEKKLYLKEDMVYNKNYFLSDEIALFITS